MNMPCRLWSTLVAFAVSFVCHLPRHDALAQSVPPRINYQGQLLQADGTPLSSGEQTLRVSIHDRASEGSRLWGPQLFDGSTGDGHSPRVRIETNGLFNIAVGEKDTNGVSLVDGLRGKSVAYLEVAVGESGGAVFPRQEILSAPFALHARAAEVAKSLEALGAPIVFAPGVDPRIQTGVTDGDPYRAVSIYSKRTTNGIDAGALKTGGLLVAANYHSFANPNPPNPGFAVIEHGLAIGVPGIESSAKLVVGGESHLGYLRLLPQYLLSSEIDKREGGEIRMEGGLNQGHWLLEAYDDEFRIFPSGATSFRFLRNGKFQSRHGEFDDTLTANGTISGKGNLIVGGNSVVQGSTTNQGESFFLRKVNIKSDLLVGTGLSPFSRVGINTTNPRATLDVASDTPVLSGRYTRVTLPRAGNNPPQIGPYDGAVSFSIYADHGVGAADFMAFSDVRIKDLVGTSNGADDLNTVRRLRVANYFPRDRIANADVQGKGFIAQEVQAVIPEAVRVSRQVIPDIFCSPKAVRYDKNEKTLLLTLEASFFGRVGDTVRVFTDESRLDLKVAQVIARNQIKLANCPSEPGGVFVYGREVADFLSVNYDRIFTTGIGALQELDRQLQAKEERLRHLEEKVRSLESIESRLNRLEVSARQTETEARLLALERRLAQQGGFDTTTESRSEAEEALVATRR